MFYQPPKGSFVFVRRACAVLALAAFVLSCAAQPADAGILDFLSSPKKEGQKAVKQPAKPATEAPAAAVAPAAPAAPAQAPVAVPAPIQQGPMAAAMPEIDAAALAAKMKSKAPPYLIDVREPVEYNDFHIDGAVSIPLGSLASSFATLPKDREIVVYCRSGSRSQIAQRAMKETGIKNVVGLKGGVQTWITLNKCDVKKKVC